MTEAELLQALSAVVDPDLKRSIVELGMIKDITWSDGTLSFTCELTTPACPVKEQIEAQIREVIREKFADVKTLNLNMTGKVRNALGLSNSDQVNFIPQIKNVVLITSGKGGVGKSILTLHLAQALHRLGAKTAVLDLDLHAPALPALVGRQERPKIQNDQQIQPLEVQGLELMSMGFLVEPRQAMLWRGQIVQGLVTQFLKDVTWSERDYLLIDMPTGGADVLLAVNHCCPVAGAVLVITPDPLTQSTAWRTKALLDQTRVPVLGLIENFSPSAAEQTGGVAAEMNLPWLGAVPKSDDDFTADGLGEKAVRAAAERLAAQLSIRSAAPQAGKLYR